jgi:hypothetical protein
MQVKVTRRGGLAGIPLRGEVNTSELPSGQARAAAAALEALPANKPPTAPSHPDGFQYELAFGGRSVTIDENEVSDSLRPVIETALENATLG